MGDKFTTPAAEKNQNEVLRTYSEQTTRTKVITVQIKQRIEQFDTLMSVYQPGQCIWSEGVASPLLQRAVWKLSTYPNGQNEQEKGTCAFFIDLTGPMVSRKEHLFASFRIQLLHEVGLTKKSWRSERVFGKEGYGRGWTKLRRERVRRLLHRDGSLLVKGEVSFVPPYVYFGLGGVALSADVLKADQLAIFGQLLDQGFGSDISLVVGEETIAAHKLILALNSPVFAVMFAPDSRFNEATEGVLRIEDFTAEPVRALLEFIYKGEIDWAWYGEWQVDVLRLADKYQLPKLKAHLEGLLASRITGPAALVDMALLADALVCPILKKACIHYLAAHQNETVDSAEWKEMKNSQPQLAIELLEEG